MSECGLTPVTHAELKDYRDGNGMGGRVTNDMDVGRSRDTAVTARMSSREQSS